VIFFRQILIAFLLVAPVTASLAAHAVRAPKTSSEARAGSAGHASKAVRQPHGGASGVRSRSGAGARGDAARAGPGRATDGHTGSRIGTDHAKTTSPATSSGTKESGANASPIDVRGGLPGANDAHRDTVHQKVEEAARQVRELQQRLTATKSPPADRGATGRLPAGTPQASNPGSASLAKGTIPGTAATSTNASASPLGSHGTASFAPAPAAKALNAGLSGGRPSTTAAINGTSMARPGIGSAAIGGSAKAVTGVNGSTVRAKR
jgi:hypothetical protein